jgi:hypothetical protein
MPMVGSLMLQSITELQSLAAWGLADLLHWAASRQLKYGLERSVRFCQNVFEPRRVLVSFSVSEIGPDALVEVLQICQRMRAPEPHLQSIRRFFSGAAYVHFGFEYSGNIVVGKCYLELPSVTGTATIAASGRLQFLGFKWAINESSMAVVTRYRIMYVPGWDELAAVLLANTGSVLQPVMQGLMTTVCERQHSGNRVPGFLEIEEEGSDRRSFDLNVYDLGLTVSQIGEPMMIAAEMLNLDSNTIENWLTTNAEAPVGHVATGLGRDQQSFLTIYYGVS